MTIDPRWGMWISIIAAILSFLVGAGATFTDLFGPETSKTIVGVAVLLNGIINAINAVLHAVPSKPGAFNEFPARPPISKTLLPTNPEGKPLRRYSPQANWEFDPVHVGVRSSIQYLHLVCRLNHFRSQSTFLTTPKEA